MKRDSSDYAHLEELLRSNPNTLVSLMHGNNEIANLLDLEKVGNLAAEHGSAVPFGYGADLGHYRHDLQQLKTHFIVGAAHKFHGPKGVGFMYLQAGTRIPPFIHGGAQERNMRGGNGKCLRYRRPGESARNRLYRNGRTPALHQRPQIPDDRTPERSDSGCGVSTAIPENVEGSLYTVLNVSFPPSADSEMLLFNLDIEGVSASGGSACSSGSDVGSHVLTALKADPSRPSARSRSPNTTQQKKSTKWWRS